ncbi:putative BOI-related E3 ubiquitin-protein ligase 1 [Iris pallida]|uniref:BOI-related E3 ubiquitin-protein ligase 1 n=1 Tax=Iris pallida TaxID=29817 RepID=A0AAX6HXF5_IRIPA|nr:putative BOI-related E3 ubiquitin-protein ligase 1 [Iris pallida]
MAVQAHYRSNVLFFNNDDDQEQENNNNNNHLHQHQHQQPPLFFSAAAANGDGTKNNNNKKKKRGREAPAQNAFSLRPLQPSAPSMISLSQLHHQPPPLAVSTGLRLSPFDNPTTTTSSSSIGNHDLFAQINHHHTQQLNHFLLAQGEQLRQTLAEKRQQHLCELLAAAEDSAAKRLAEKQAEVDRAARRTAELEERLARLRTESMAWQAKAVAEQSAAALLHAQLQSAAAGPEVCGGGDRAEDAESAHVDPERAGVCRCCRVEPVSVVLLPCRHLCLCAGCNAVTAGECCPVCQGARTGGVQVFFS